MIMAFDEGAWHPDGWFLLLTMASAVIPFVPLMMLAHAKIGRGFAYLVTALPFLAAAAFIVYAEHGLSGSYTGDGTLGADAHVNVAAIPGQVLPFMFCFAPNVFLLRLSQWYQEGPRSALVFGLFFAWAQSFRCCFPCGSCWHGLRYEVHKCRPY